MSDRASDRGSDQVSGRMGAGGGSSTRVSFRGARRVKGIALSELCSGLAERVDTDQADPLITSVTLDIDEVEAGCLFIARALWYINTHTQLSEAIERGAAALLVSDLEMTRGLLGDQGGRLNADLPVMYTPDEDPTLGLLCDRFYDHPTRALKVYGVTGTNGKTSAVSYLTGLLRAVGERVAVIGTVAYAFESRELSAPNTTPDALVIHRFAREALDLGASALALEVSSHALSLGRVAGVSFNAVGFTSWGRDHLDFHKTMEGYRDAKASLFSHYLRASEAYAEMSSGEDSKGEASRGGPPLVAVAHNDEMGRYMLAQTPPNTRLVSCEVHSHDMGVYPAEQSEQSEQALTENKERWSLKLKHIKPPTVSGVFLSAQWGAHSTAEAGPEIEPEMRREVRLETSAIEIPLIGDYHPSNLAIALGMVGATHPARREAAWLSLSEARGVPGRMELVELPNLLDESERRGRRRSAFVDYAHTPDAITRATSALRAVHDAPISVIIGCGGDRDRGKRPAMVRAALALADEVWLTSDNPRHEPPEQIIADALELPDLSALQSALSSGEVKLDGRPVRVVIDRRACIAQAWRELDRSGALLIMGKGHERYQEIGERRYALHDVEALRAAAWAEAEALSIGEVPYIRSSPALAATLRGVDVNSLSAAAYQSLVQTLFMKLLREAASRPRGLSIGVTSRSGLEGRAALDTALNTALIVDVDVLYTGNIDASAPLSLDTSSLITLRILSALTPSKSVIALLSQDQQIRAALNAWVDACVADLSLSDPHLSVHRITPLELAADRDLSDLIDGGWSKMVSGPKIPSLSSPSRASLE